MDKPNDNITAKVNSHLIEKAQELAAEFIEEVLHEIKWNCFNGRPIVSPVEQLFFIEWELYQKRTSSTLFDLMPQHQDKTTGKYFIDFVVNFELGAYPNFNNALTLEQFRAASPPMLGVEIDGHVWHEKTKKQVQYHKERERFLIKNGWKLLRFTGSEIYDDPRKYFFEVIDVARKMSMEYYEKLQALIT